MGRGALVPGAGEGPPRGARGRARAWLAPRGRPTPGHARPTPRRSRQSAGDVSRLFVSLSAPLPRGRAQSSHCSKLEKADILEMTVRFLQELPASSGPAAAPGE